jgi:hypothetical protein
MEDYVVLHCICCQSELKVGLAKFLEYALKHPGVTPNYSCGKCESWLTFQLDMIGVCDPFEVPQLPPPR